MINKNLFDNESAVFMGAKRNPADCSIGIFGVNYDGTCSYKSGTRFGPNAIRLVSTCLETFCPRLGKDLEDFNYVDFGSLEIDKYDSKSVIKLVKSASSSATFFPSATVRTITPKFLGTILLIKFFNLSFSLADFNFCEIEILLEKGSKTIYLPAKDISEISLGPLVDIGSLETCTKTSSFFFNKSSIFPSLGILGSALILSKDHFEFFPDIVLLTKEES